MRRWILEKCAYKIENESGDNNKWPCNVDFALMTIYAVVSIFNAVKIWFPSTVIFFGVSLGGNAPTLSVFIINFIVLVRLHVGLYIKLKDSRKAELKKLAEQREVVEDISINAWNTRLWIIYIGYVIDIMIGLFYLLYRTYVEKFLSFAIVVSVMWTFFNNFLDNAIMRYEATPKVYKY